MAKNVMKMLKPSPKRGKNAFDLSHRHVLGANFGELLPVTSLETVPGDYFEINCADLLRAMPMVTSPFLRAKQHIDFWFVPYTDLWHQFNAFITQKSQPQSAAMKNANFCPHVGLNTVLTTVFGSGMASETDVVGRDYRTGAAKLFNLFGYGEPSAMTPSEQNVYPDINLWRVLAYNYIWYNEYRQNYYDDGSRLIPNGGVAQLFNVDDLVCSSYSNADISSDADIYEERLQAMFQMRYRTWKKDLFTGVMPSTQFGDVSTVGISNFAGIHEFVLQQSNLDDSFVGSRVLGFASSSDKLVDTLVPPTTNNYVSMVDPARFKMQQRNLTTDPYQDFSPYGARTDSQGNVIRPAIDILSLRQAQAVQIWRENALRSGNRVNDNMRGHFGDTPDYQRDHRPTYIGSYDAPLNISDVNATAQTGSGGNQSLGDVAGKGISSLDSKTLKFNCNDFGVIMGIFSLLPEAEYNATGIERTNQLLDRFDYFSPEMENLGLEAVSSHNFRARTTQGQVIVGYAPRYFGYKTKLDKCFGNFMTDKSLEIWCSPKYDVDIAIDTMQYGMPLSVLYVNPTIFDVNFVADSATIGEQFLCDFFFDVQAVRAMTVLGLPTAG